MIKPCGICGKDVITMGTAKLCAPCRIKHFKQQRLEIGRRWSLNNPEKERSKKLKYRLLHGERVRFSSRKRRSLNKTLMFWLKTCVVCGKRFWANHPNEVMDSKECRSQREKEQKNKWVSENQDKVSAKTLAWNKKNIDRVMQSNGYIAQLLGGRVNNFPTAFIECKRAHIKITRLLKEQTSCPK